MVQGATRPIAGNLPWAKNPRTDALERIYDLQTTKHAGLKGFIVINGQGLRYFVRSLYFKEQYGG